MPTGRSPDQRPAGRHHVCSADGERLCTLRSGAV